MPSSITIVLVCFMPRLFSLISEENSSGVAMWEKCHYARCFGHWLVSDAECLKCAVADGCEKRTKAILSELSKKPEECDYD